MSLHMSKCHIVGNHMSLLISLSGVIFKLQNWMSLSSPSWPYTHTLIVVSIVQSL